MPELTLVDREGTFRGRITEFGLYEAESGAVAVNITAVLDEMYYEDEWSDISDWNMIGTGSQWIVKKNGKVNESAVQSLCKYAGWDGQVKSITEMFWQPKPCQFSIEEDSYKDDKRFRIAWLNDFDATPGGGINQMSEVAAKALESRVGGELRAIASSTTMNDRQPAGRPKPPAPSKADENGSDEGEEKIPF